MGRSDLDKRTRIVIRHVVYPIQFLPDPLRHADEVADGIRNGPQNDICTEEYVEKIQAALASDSRVSEIVKQQHPEEIIRAYLSLLVGLLKAK